MRDDSVAVQNLESRLRKDREFRRQLAYLLEFILLVIFAIIAGAVGVGIEHVAFHCGFAIATASLVHCVDSCTQIHDRCELLDQIKDYGSESMLQLPFAYRYLIKTQKRKLGWFVLVTVASVVIWIGAAACYALLVAAPLPESKSAILALFGFLVALGLFLAAWKVSDACRVPKALELKAILSALYPSRIQPQ